MKHFIALTVALLSTSAVSTARAQFPFSSGFSSSHGAHSHSAFRHEASPRHQCDVARLTNMVGELGVVCTHLHDDVHHLSQDYSNSAALEAYVSRLDRLKRHTHDMLVQAASSGTYSTHTERFLKRDISDVRSLLEQFYSLVTGQACAGARGHDLRLLEHMEQVILHEAFPLLVRIEVELFGRAQGGSCPVAFSRGHSANHSAVRHTSRYGHNPFTQPEYRVESRTTYRPATPPVPPIPPFAARMLSQSGFPMPPGVSRSRVQGSPSIRLGNLRISF
ncbi:MAG: hypothetical protein Aurels2KO_12450 [Aureliella sp.]